MSAGQFALIRQIPVPDLNDRAAAILGELPDIVVMGGFVWRLPHRCVHGEQCADDEIEEADEEKKKVLSTEC
jgi:hypothetical protein